MIVIRSLTEGFRRAGVAHSKKPTEYDDDFFTGEQLTALQNEKMLIVEIFEGVEGVPKGLNAKDTIALVKQAADVESLNVLADGEERTSVLDAIEKRTKELEAQSGGE